MNFQKSYMLIFYTRISYYLQLGVVFNFRQTENLSELHKLLLISLCNSLSLYCWSTYYPRSLISSCPLSTAIKYCWGDMPGDQTLPQYYNLNFKIFSFKEGCSWDGGDVFASYGDLEQASHGGVLLELVPPKDPTVVRIYDIANAC